MYSQEVHGISMQEIDYQGDVYYYQGQYNSRKGAYDSDCSNLYVGTKFINYNSIPVNVEITIHKPFDIKYHEQEYGTRSSERVPGDFVVKVLSIILQPNSSYIVKEFPEQFKKFNRSQWYITYKAYKLQ